MTLNRLIFPRLAQYLDGLPKHLDTHPTALTRSDYSIILRKRLEKVLTETSLPSSVLRALNAPWKLGEWIPTTVYIALCDIARDQLWLTDEAFHQGMFDVATEMYSGPLLKMMFFMFGPSLVALSAAKRWDTLHQGTKLVVVKQQKESIQMLLQFPHKLVSEAGVKSLGAAICATVAGSRGKNTKYSLLKFNDTEAELLVEWKYG